MRRAASDRGCIVGAKRWFKCGVLAENCLGWTSSTLTRSSECSVESACSRVGDTIRLSKANIGEEKGMRPNNTLQRTSEYRGRLGLAMNCALGKAEGRSFLAAALGR